jgi:sugar lactone lactonase YvrE
MIATRSTTRAADHPSYRGGIVHVERVGSFTLGWGESLVWDERLARLYFVDCAAQTLHWLEDGDGRRPLVTMQLPSMAAGIVPTEDGTLVGALDDGLHVIDPDAGTTTLLSEYPPGLGSRANDACADWAGNLITGTLNLAPAPGSAWWFSTQRGWKLLDPDIANTNGPTACHLSGEPTLIIGDTSGDYYAYPYDAEAGTVGPRRIYGDVQALDGVADGATLDADDGLWCALIGGAQLVRFTTTGLDCSLPLPVANPADVTFGGTKLDRLYIVSVQLLPGATDLDGALLVVDDLGLRGRPEPRVRLS